MVPSFSPFFSLLLSAATSTVLTLLVANRPSNGPLESKCTANRKSSGRVTFVLDRRVASAHRFDYAYFGTRPCTPTRWPPRLRPKRGEKGENVPRQFICTAISLQSCRVYLSPRRRVNASAVTVTGAAYVTSQTNIRCFAVSFTRVEILLIPSYRDSSPAIRKGRSRPRYRITVSEEITEGITGETRCRGPNM